MDALALPQKQSQLEQMSQGIPPSISTVDEVLSISKDEDCTTSLCDRFQCLTTPTVKKSKDIYV